MCSTELQRDRPVFEGEVPVLVQRDDREDTHVPLYARVIWGTRKLAGQQPQRLLRVEVTDEVDPFFLYSLEVTEEEFHELKQDQVRRRCVAALRASAPKPRVALPSRASPRCMPSPWLICPTSTLPPRSRLAPKCIRVDFPEFPEKFVELLRLCIAAGSERTAKFRAVLQCGPSSAASPRSCLQIVEANNFKDLLHLRLRVRVRTGAPGRPVRRPRPQACAAQPVSRVRLCSPAPPRVWGRPATTAT